VTDPRVLNFASPFLRYLKARNSSFHWAQFTFIPNLVQLAFDDNPLTTNIDELINMFDSLVACSQLQVISMERCGLSINVHYVSDALAVVALATASFAQNNLYGWLPRFDFLADMNFDSQSPWPESMQQLTLSFNPNLTGPLPDVSVGPQLQSIQLNGCGIQGSIPESWRSFKQLQTMDLSNTQLQCQLQFTHAGEVSQSAKQRESLEIHCNRLISRAFLLAFDVSCIVHSQPFCSRRGRLLSCQFLPTLLLSLLGFTVPRSD
jgi:hypothetical protein